MYINHVFQFVARILEIGALLQNPQGMVDTLGDTDLPGEKVGRYILAPHLDLHAVIFLELIEQIPKRSVAEGNQPLAPQEPFVLGYPPQDQPSVEVCHLVRAGAARHGCSY